MGIGDIVIAKEDSRLVGEVIDIDDYDRATVRLEDSGVEVIIWMDDLRVIGGEYGG